MDKIASISRQVLMSPEEMKEELDKCQPYDENEFDYFKRIAGLVNDGSPT